MRDFDLKLGDGRTLHAYDTEAKGTTPIFWFHGTPNLGEPPEPLFGVAAELGMRWLSYDRPGYGGSSPYPGRTIGSAAGDVAAIATAVGIDRFAVMGHSGGASHALGCAALLPEGVMGVISISALAPIDAKGLDWFGGMLASGVASLRAAVEGREAKMKYETSDAEYDPEFTPADRATLESDWAWMGRMAAGGMKTGPFGLIDDDIAYVNPWGCDPAQIEVPTLILHGGADRIAPPSHGRWLADHIAGAELWFEPDAGHVSMLERADSALRQLRDQL